MMFRGIPIPENPLKMRRLVDWFFEERKKELAKTTLLVTAMLTDKRDQSSINKLNKSLNEYRNCLFPSDQSNEEMAQRMQEYMDSIEGQTLTVVKK